MIIDDFPSLVVVLPLIAAFTVPVIGFFSKKLIPYFISLITFIAFIISLFNLQTVMNTGTISYTMGGWLPPWGIEYRIDYLNAFVSIVVIFIIFIISIYTRKSVEQELPGKTVPFYTLFLLLTSGLEGLIVTGDIFNIYVFLEISSLAAYALISVGKSRDAKYEQYLRKEFGELPNLDMVGFIDQFSSDRHSRILEDSWVFVNTAAREALPNAFIEAASHKCAILSSVDPDGFASNFGYHAEDDNFKLGLEKLLEKDLWRSQGENGYKYMKDVFEVNKSIDRHLGIYERLTGLKRPEVNT